MPQTTATLSQHVEEIFVLPEQYASDLSKARAEVAADRTARFGGLFFFDLTLLTIDLYLALIDAKDFYAAKKRIDFYDTPAVRMAYANNLIAKLDFHRKDPISLIGAVRKSGLDPLILPCALGLLLTLLEDLCSPKYQSSSSTDISSLEGFLHQFRELDDDEFAEYKSTGDYHDFKEFLDTLALDLKNLQTTLRLIEHDIYDEHLDWEVLHYESEDDPLDERADRLNQSISCHAYFVKYGNSLSDFEAAARQLTSDYETVKSSLSTVGRSPIRHFEKLVATPVFFSYESPLTAILSGGRENSVSGSLNPWLKDAKQQFLNALHEFFKHCEAEYSGNGSQTAFLTSTAAKLFAAQCDYEEAKTPPPSEDQTKPATRKVGRPKSQGKEDQVFDALKFAKAHPEKSAAQLADHVYELEKLGIKNYPNGYTRSTPLRNDNLVRQINRVRAKARKQDRTN